MVDFFVLPCISLRTCPYKCAVTALLHVIISNLHSLILQILLETACHKNSLTSDVNFCQSADRSFDVNQKRERENVDTDNIILSVAD